MNILIIILHGAEVFIIQPYIQCFVRIFSVPPDVPECEEEIGDTTNKLGKTSSDPTIDKRHYAALNKKQRKTN